MNITFNYPRYIYNNVIYLFLWKNTFAYQYYSNSEHSVKRLGKEVLGTIMYIFKYKKVVYILCRFYINELRVCPVCIHVYTT